MMLVTTTIFNMTLLLFGKETLETSLLHGIGGGR